jgi:hypothetical protein
MVSKPTIKKAADVEAAQAEAPHLAKVDWKKDPGLRKLYFWAFIICIASATTGYDGLVIFICTSVIASC